MIIWNCESPTAGSIAATLRAAMGVELHDLAVRHLCEVHGQWSLAFPRLERHNNYLFGMVYFPANPDNPSADFDRVTFVATHDDVFATVLQHESSTLDWEQLRKTIAFVDEEDDLPDGGEFIFRVFHSAVELQLHDATNIQEELDVALSLGDSVNTKRSMHEYLGTSASEFPSPSQRRELLTRFNALKPELAAIESEMTTMGRVAVETEAILVRLANDDERLDLRTDLDGRERELFTQDLEIELGDTVEKNRVLLATLDEIEATLTGTAHLTGALNEEEAAAAGRFTGAIASIMLLPTFIVGLYGQNFVDMPELRWQFGYGLSWGAIVLLTLGQWIFFRRRNWL